MPAVNSLGRNFLRIASERLESSVQAWRTFRQLRQLARQLYKNISMLFLFPVKDGKLSTGVNAKFNASCYGQSSTI